MTRSVYLYGFLGADAPSPPADLLGVGGEPVELVDLGPVRAAVSRVSATGFAPERIEERVHDLEWLAEQGALHERVVTWFVDHGGILPVRLLTLYSGAGALAGAVAPRAAELAGDVDRLSGLREWDLKVSYDKATLSRRLGDVSGAVAALEAEIEQAAPGRRYLLERKLKALVDEETGRAARRLASEAHERLSAAAAEARILPLPREAEGLPVVLNAAYLLHRDREEEARLSVAEEGRRLAPLGLEVRFTGPWAPYRFVGDETAPQEEGGAGGG